MSFRRLAAGHQAVAQIDYFRDGNDAFRLLFAVGELHEKVEDFWDQFLRKTKIFEGVIDVLNNFLGTYCIWPFSMYSNCFRTKFMNTCSASKRR